MISGLGTSYMEKHHSFHFKDITSGRYLKEILRCQLQVEWCCWNWKQKCQRSISKEWSLATSPEFLHLIDKSEEETFMGSQSAQLRKHSQTSSRVAANHNIFYHIRLDWKLGSVKRTVWCCEIHAGCLSVNICTLNINLELLAHRLRTKVKISDMPIINLLCLD